MPKSTRFRLLNKELNRLKRQFLPQKMSSTGLYTDTQLARTLAYRVFTHAEIESYLEDVALEAKRAWDSTGKTCLTLISLVAFSGTPMDRPPETLTPN